jgi:hypothetical protein
MSAVSGPYASPAAVDLSFSRDPRFTYEEGRHVYRYDGEILPSVSSVCKELAEVFDADRVAGFVARKRGTTKRAVLAEWAAKRDRAVARGNVVHAAVEAYLATGRMPTLPEGHGLPLDDAWDVRRRLLAFRQWATVHLAGVQVVATELRTYSLALGIAGTLDTLLLRAGYLYISDWKTNGAFRCGEKGERVYGHLRPPLAHLPDIELTGYSIQNSLYRIILAEHGIQTAGGFIVHMPEEGPPRMHRALDLRRLLWGYLAGS